MLGEGSSLYPETFWPSREGGLPLGLTGGSQVAWYKVKTRLSTKSHLSAPLRRTMGATSRARFLLLQSPMSSMRCLHVGQRIDTAFVERYHVVNYEALGFGVWQRVVDGLAADVARMLTACDGAACLLGYC